LCRTKSELRISSAKESFLFEIFPYESDEPGLHSFSVTTSYFKKTAQYSVLQIKEAMKA